MQLKKVILGKDISQERVEIRKTIPAMNQLIYSTRNLKYLATEYGKVLYWFMMIFQRFDYFISSYDKNIEISKEEEKYLVKLAELLEFIGEKLSIEGNKESILKIEKFQMEEKNISLNLKEGIGEILNLLKLALSQMKTKGYHKHEKNGKYLKRKKK